MGGEEPDPKLLKKQFEEFLKRKVAEEVNLTRLRWLFGKGPKPKDKA